MGVPPQDRIAGDSNRGEGEGSNAIFDGGKRALQSGQVSGKFSFMNKRMIFAAGLILAVAPAATAALAQNRIPAPPVTIFATVGHSEWCPSGRVRVNLGTGRYTVTAPRTWGTCRRPPWTTRTWTAALDAEELASLRAAYQNAVSEGLENPVCRGGRRPDYVVVNNGGTPTLRLTDIARTTSPPNDLTCWSDAATQLHQVLENLFNPRTARHH